jgi:hypothetical protein
MIDDLSIGGSDHVLRIKSETTRAATASLAIGRLPADSPIERFGLT